MNHTITIDEIGSVSIIVDEPERTAYQLILAHGAGAGMDHVFLNELADELKKRSIRVIRFNFPYKEKGKKMPGSPKESIRAWFHIVKNTLEKYPDDPLFISGKSYGGRMASHLMAEHTDLPVKGIIYYGFPLHPPGKPGTKRADYLKNVIIPQLFLQGSRDKLADIDLISEVTKPLLQTSIIKIDLADHSFKVPKSTGISQAQTLARLADETLHWIQLHMSKS